MTEPDSETRRRYDATARQERARGERLRTRARIVAAARAAFLADGYARSSVAAIAAAAEVSVQTVYLAVGSKAELLRAVGRDAVLDSEEAASVPGMSWVPTLAAETDPRAQIRLLVSGSRALAERAAPIWRVLTEAAGGDPTLEPDVRELEAGRFRDQRALAGLLHGLSVPVERAADIIHGILSPDLWRVLVQVRGWSGDEVERFVADVLTHALLDRDAGG